MPPPRPKLPTGGLQKRPFIAQIPETMYNHAYQLPHMAFKQEQTLFNDQRQ